MAMKGSMMLRGLLRFKPSKTACRGYHDSATKHVAAADTHVVDLRSDTITLPTPAMRQAMANAEVGDDVFGEDPTINKLQHDAAEMFGMEASLFVPTGTMGNLISVLAHCHERGVEVLLGDKSHIHLFEQGGVATLGGVHPRTFPTMSDGTFDLDNLEMYMRPNTDPHQPLSKLICVENTHNLCGGKVLSTDFLRKLKIRAREFGLNVHMDGARVMNAAVAQRIPVSEILQHVDTVSVCLSKGIGAPVGSLIGGSHEFIARCLRLRKALGGGMRQAGIVGAAAQVALQDVTSRLHQDHIHAKMLAQAIVDNSQGVVDIDIDGLHTNIVMIDILKEGLTSKDICDRLEEVTELDKKRDLNIQVRVKPARLSNTRIRMVLNCNVDTEAIKLAIEKWALVCQELADTRHRREAMAA